MLCSLAMAIWHLSEPVSVKLEIQTHEWVGCLEVILKDWHFRNNIRSKHLENLSISAQVSIKNPRLQNILICHLHASAVCIRFKFFTLLFFVCFLEAAVCVALFDKCFSRSKTTRPSTASRPRANFCLWWRQHMAAFLPHDSQLVTTFTSWKKKKKKINRLCVKNILIPVLTIFLDPP